MAQENKNVSIAAEAEHILKLDLSYVRIGSSKQKLREK